LDRRQLMWGMTVMAMSLGESGAALGQAVDDQTVYELRIYHLNEGKLPLIEERFRTKERALFERHEMHQVAYWTPTDEPLAGRTWVYILRHKSRAVADANWAKFKADPDWIALKAETEKDGPFVNKYDITFLKLTDFSPKI
jgi:hypothetical protein